ncbi:putative NRPS-like protein biosynthetic cluster [Bacidia gigantensis]|uniref:putative NRPS-like protein biosynthetic cluster n=1 Tax=Bacidia gigantensis TaxID=2732470 RepID=UPI001D04E7BC|nr:putative NRPS-like protein biosynthetic cluster [Bacidia gigantensis]KAG8531758.1 putative NRPS-like protein biosynthetic cluster [Bacidia gigantensis]
MAQLPDPTVDLDWSGYVGSIQEIFARNAQQHPDRVCVIETKSSTTPERIFTYQQIFEASNLLAHHLHEKGVSNGDIVMLYAHRSVDLVVGIMGILASGATMSVLDPLYPPARQKIYLEVAQPRALVNLSRATAEAGELAPLVRSYIDDELDLKAEVPALQIDDKGVLSGGFVDGKDILSEVRAKASAPPDVLVGPDSNPTLSFTSGSEGRPKGVLGRHFSLAYYFDWMSQRFSLSAQSKFTLLSGIAHDPVQRDIFTPLFLGASLLVPSREDIQHEKLAEWMKIHEPTCTHLTPAMGQILVGGSTAEFESLQAAFFVGDVLRAVSYYEVPSLATDLHALDKLGDTIPAGRGMKNVQLLVVNREDRTKMCAINEIGEIYVRAAGLAERYLGDQTLNDKKFVINWFLPREKFVEADAENDKAEPWRRYYRGPRDRMYRTGDLGRYTETADVECTGRADDQVKIRGFRIELNEIDSNLSQHRLVRDCKTLLRRDKFEEPKLVSYVVPEMKIWPDFLKERNLKDIQDRGIEDGPVRYFQHRFSAMQDELRHHLQGRLPDYARPSILVALEKLPLNPNGKVDRNVLPAPDVAERKQEATAEELQRWEKYTPTERAVATLWAEIVSGLNAKKISPENDIFQLGLHSLLAQQLLLRANKQLQANISINVLYQYPTLAEFSKQIDRRLVSTNGTNGTHVSEEEQSYAKDKDDLLEDFPKSFQAPQPAGLRTSAETVVFLTGCTGFVGSYIVKDILERSNTRLIALVRGVKDAKAGLSRLRRSLQSYGLYNDRWESKLSVALGDISKPQLGLPHEEWTRLSETVDVSIHNGAIVHWVKPYQDMRASNVLSTLELLNLCNIGKPKIFTFISSTSVLDAPHYTSLPPHQPVQESDDLLGSSTGLGTGYGQTKWVSEQLVLEAGRRGLCGSIVRPGYILGDNVTGICNTDDFLIRMLKGSLQLSCRPAITNTINCVPVNHVARVIVAAAFNPLPNVGVSVVHVNANPRLRMQEFLGLLQRYGYDVPEVSYETWKQRLEAYVSAGAVGQERDQEQLALMPLYHFCVNDLPGDTKAPELDDRNARAVLGKDVELWGGEEVREEYGIDEEDVGRYLRYLIEIKFLGQPKKEKGKKLPEIQLGEEVRKAMGGMGGRGGVVV